MSTLGNYLHEQNYIYNLGWFTTEIDALPGIHSAIIKEHTIDVHLTIENSKKKKNDCSTNNFKHRQYDKRK